MGLRYLSVRGNKRITDEGVRSLAGGREEGVNIWGEGLESRGEGGAKECLRKGWKSGLEEVDVSFLPSMTVEGLGDLVKRGVNVREVKADDCEGVEWVGMLGPGGGCRFVFVGKIVW